MYVCYDRSLQAESNFSSLPSLHPLPVIIRGRNLRRRSRDSQLPLKDDKTFIPRLFYMYPKMPRSTSIVDYSRRLFILGLLYFMLDSILS